MVAWDSFYEHLSFTWTQTADILCIPAPFGQTAVGCSEWSLNLLTFSSSSLTHLMSHLAIVCLGCCVFDVPLSMQIHATRGWSWETDVSHMPSKFHSTLALFCSFSSHSLWLLILCHHFSSERPLQHPKCLLEIWFAYCSMLHRLTGNHPSCLDHMRVK